MSAAEPEPSDPRDRRGPSDEALKRMAAATARPLPRRLLWCLPLAIVGVVAFTAGVTLVGGRITTTVVLLGFLVGLAASLFQSFVARPRVLRLYGDGTTRHD
ncbi:hypothetical protein [Aeromicrobium alkaliterrae]|uniref:hypothetical protein n=1 Tax=Aeromicrobium alkaliterrae TaxID=302168 RepID=UPI0031DF9007